MTLFILLCNEEKQTDIRQFIAEAKEEIEDITPPVWSWSCGNTKGIQVGDRILFQRTGKKPNGFFASGLAVAAVEEYQLRLTEDKYVDFSEAYIAESYGSSFMILVEIHTFVDYDFPLEKAKVKAMPDFRDISLHFQRGGCEIKPDYLANLLYSEWEKHSMELARKGLGVRLVDILCEKGREYKTQKKYQEAIDLFEEALIYDPEYAKAKNGIESCNSILKRLSVVTSADSSIVKDNTEITSDDDDNKDNTEITSDDDNNDNVETLVIEAFFGKPENNRRVEVAAIDFVTKFYEKDGWSVTSVERDKVGYDLICRRGLERLHVEVKGISGNTPQFIITANELQKAKNDNLFVLCVVTSALTNPTLQRWTGVEMLQEFNFEPLAYKAKLTTL